MSPADSTQNPFRPPAPESSPGAGELVAPSAEPDRLQLAFETSFDDWAQSSLAYLRHYRFFARMHQKGRTLGSWTIILGAATFFLEDSRISLELFRYCLFGLGALIMLGYGPFMQRRSILRVRNNVTSQGGPYFGIVHHVDVSPDGIRDSSAVAELHLRWTFFTQILADKEGVYLYSGESHAITLPRRAFADDASFARAHRFISNCWQKRNTTPL